MYIFIMLENALLLAKMYIYSLMADVFNDNKHDIDVVTIDYARLV